MEKEMMVTTANFREVPASALPQLNKERTEFGKE